MDLLRAGWQIMRCLARFLVAPVTWAYLDRAPPGWDVLCVTAIRDNGVVLYAYGAWGAGLYLILRIGWLGHHAWASWLAVACLFAALLPAWRVGQRSFLLALALVGYMDLALVAHGPWWVLPMGYGMLLAVGMIVWTRPARPEAYRRWRAAEPALRRRRRVWRRGLAGLHSPAGNRRRADQANPPPGEDAEWDD